MHHETDDLRSWIIGGSIALTVGVACVMNGLQLWTALQIGRSLSHNENTITFGLDLNELIIVLGTFGFMLWKFIAPVLGQIIGTRALFLATLLAVIWISSLSVSCGLFVLGLSKLAPGVYSSPTFLFAAAVICLMLDALISLLPLALQDLSGSAGARRERHERHTEIGNVHDEQQSNHPDGHSTIVKEVHACLSRIAESGPGHFEGGIHVLEDHTIITSQASLARLTGRSKGGINRALHSLHVDGLICLSTLPRETRITLLTKCNKAS